MQTRMTLAILAATLLIGVGAGPVQAVVEGDQTIPFFTDTDPNYDSATGKYVDPNTGNGWYYARNSGASLAVAKDTGSATRPVYVAGEDLWRHNYGTVPNYAFTSSSLGSVLTANQHPRPVVIFQASVAGNYSFRGTAQFDWAATGNITASGQISQLRMDIQKLPTAIVGTDPAAAWSSGEYLAHSGGTSLNVDQASGTHTVDLATVAELQNIALGAGEFLSIQVGSRGLLGEAGDSATMQYNAVANDPVRIFGPMIPEPATLGLLALGGLTMVSRRRR